MTEFYFALESDANSAAASAAAAAASATAALGSQNAAATSATSAAAQVVLAAAQVTLAAAQVALATTQAGNAATSAAASAASAATASTQAGIATTQAGIATTQASAAAASAVAAAASAASFPSTPFSIANGGTGQITATLARTALGLAIGTDVEAHSANLDAWSLIATSTKQAASANLTTLAGITPGATGQALLADATVAAALATLGITPTGGLSTNGTNLDMTANQKAFAIEYCIDGGGSAITVGTKFGVMMTFAGTISSWDIGLDQSGSIVIDIWKVAKASYPPTVTNSITASAKPTVTAAVDANSSTLTGWTTSFAAGDWLWFHVDSITTAQFATIVLSGPKT